MSTNNTPEVLSNVADYLAAEGCGTVGQTIFEHDMPAGVKDGVLLLNSYYGTPIDPELPGYRRAEFRLIVRSTNVETGKALANKVSRLLIFEGESTAIAEILVKKAWAENEPRTYKRSAGGYWEFEVDIQMRYVIL